jgi:hypothetical protein
VWLANILADAELLDEAKAAAEKVLSIDPCGFIPTAHKNEPL